MAVDLALTMAVALALALALALTGSDSGSGSGSGRGPDSGSGSGSGRGSSLEPLPSQLQALPLQLMDNIEPLVGIGKGQPWGFRDNKAETCTADWIFITCRQHADEAS